MTKPITPPVKEKMFSLSMGTRFIFNDRKFTMGGFIRKFMPTIGRVMVCKARGDDGKIALFSTNWEVEKI